MCFTFTSSNDFALKKEIRKQSKTAWFHFIGSQDGNLLQADYVTWRLIRGVRCGLGSHKNDVLSILVRSTAVR